MPLNRYHFEIFQGRRRRRIQQRKANQAFLSGMKHADGMSSDDEMSSLDQSTLGNVRQDVENQARTGIKILGFNIAICTWSLPVRP